MSIATQITRLNNNIEAMKTTKQQIKDAMNNDFDIIANEQIEDYAELIEDGLELYKDCIPSEVTNQATEISVNDAMKYSRNKLELFGNTSQASYTGKNLFNIGNTTISSRGIDWIPQNDGSVKIQGTATGTATYGFTSEKTILAGQYTFSIKNPISQKLKLRCKKISDSTYWYTSIPIGNTSALFNIPEDMSSIQLYIDTELSTGDKLDYTIYPQLESGTEATDYEPYVGGLPSPNPNYPQDIHVVTGNNTVAVQGKNLAKSFVNGTSLTQYQSSIFIDGNFEIGKKYVLSFVDKSVGNSYYRNENFMLNPSSYSITATGERQTYYFECKSNDKTKNNVYSANKGYIILKNNTALENLPQFEDIQIEEVESYNIPATDYVPYYHADYPINLGSIELCKIGNYQDYLYKENGNWYKYEAIYKAIRNGTESWITGNYGTNSYYHVNTAIKDIQSQAVILANLFRGVSYNNRASSGNNIIYFETGSNKYNEYVRGTDFSSVSAFTEYLSENNLILYYIKNTPTSTQITDTTLIAQLDAIYEHLQLEKGTNHITVTASDFNPYMKLSYKNYELTSNE